MQKETLRTELNLQTLYQEHLPSVYRVAYSYMHNSYDSEDAAQEAMVQLWRYCAHIDPERNVRALAIRVAKNCCVNMHRKRQAKYELPSPVMEVSPQELLEASDAQRMMEETIALLKPRERQLFEMRQLEGLSNDDISQETGIPKASVKAMVSIARKKVLQELTKRLKQ